MARTRKNGKEVDYQKRDAYKIRKRTSRIQRKNKNGALLKNLQLELANRTAKQNRRWIKHIVESPHRGGMSPVIEHELMAHTRTVQQEEQQQQLQQPTKLTLRRPAPPLKPKAMAFWTTLMDQRKAAMAGQGYRFEAEDWWVDANEGSGGTKKGRKTQMKSAVRDLNARMQELGVDGDDGEEEEEEGEEDENVENEEGGVPLAGVYSPIMLSPVRSPSLEEDFSGLNPLDS